MIIAGSSVGELALHYLNRANIAVLKVLSKFDLRRLCRVVNATPLARLGAPTPEETGWVDVYETVEVGGDRVTVLRQLGEGEEGYESGSGGEKTRTATIVLRGATMNRLDDLERAVDDGVNVLKALLRDGRMVPGAGATELELAKRVEAYGGGLKGLAQHAVKRWAGAMEVVPRTLAENALGGMGGNEVLGRLWGRHGEVGGEAWGVDVEVRFFVSFLCRPPPLLNLVSMLTFYLSGDSPKRTERCLPPPPLIKSWTPSLRNTGPSSWPQRPLCRC